MKILRTVLGRMKKISIDLYIEEDLLQKIEYLNLKEKRRTLSYLASQIFNLVVKRLSIDDLILLIILGSRLRKIDAVKRFSLLESAAIAVSEEFNNLLSDMMNSAIQLTKKKEEDNVEEKKREIEEIEVMKEKTSDESKVESINLEDFLV